MLLSQWFCDLFVHIPDLKLAGSLPKLGLGLWNHPALEMPLEIGLVPACACFWGRKIRTTRGEWALNALVVVLLSPQAGNGFAAPTTTIDVAVWGLALLVYLAIAGIVLRVATNHVHR